MTSRDHESLVKVKLVAPIRLERNISKTAGDRDFVPKDHQQEMACGVSNGHVIDVVTWLPKVLWGSTVGYPSAQYLENSCRPTCYLETIAYY